MDELLAKNEPEVLLIDHLKDVLSLGASIANRFGLNERLYSKALLSCALHDIGKATLDFQKYIRHKKGKAYPHALAALPFILVVETKLNTQHNWDAYDLTATAAVLTHHSPLSPNLYKGFTLPKFHSQLYKLLEEIWQLLIDIGGIKLPKLDEFVGLISPLLNNSPANILDDFSIEPRFSLRGRLQNLFPDEFATIKTVLHLSDWLASAYKKDCKMLFLSKGQELIELKTAGLTLWDFQKKAKLVRPEKLYLKAPTGTGKTEALLLWAGNTDRLIYLLPTQATVNAMWRRLRQIYGDDQVSLAHGRASYLLLKEIEEDPLEVRLFGSVFAKPVTVATIDQYLLAHLNGRHWEERRYLARQATVILDEIHTYEPYTLGLLAKALEKEDPYRLAIASATLPSALLNFFPQAELIEAEELLWHRTRHRLIFCDEDLSNNLIDALSFAHKGKNVLIVVNTIRKAQKIYQILKDDLCWEKTNLLHAHFIFRDRINKEAAVANPPPGTIFISTQVVEVSLDISYDVLLTEIAPIDALVQRMGRVNRKGNKAPVPVVIYCCSSEDSQKVYGQEVLKWSLDILKTLPEIPTDRDLAQAADKLYECVVPSKEWRKEFYEGGQTLEEVRKILGCYTIDLSDEDMKRKFTSRRGQISIDVLPKNFLEEAYYLREQNENWRLVELLVPIPIWWIKSFPENFNQVRDLNFIITELSYDSNLGLSSPRYDKTQDNCSYFEII